MKKKQNIGKLDRDLKTGVAALAGMDIYRVDDRPIRLTGLPWRKKDGAFCRLPEEMDLDFSPAVKRLHRCTAGAAIRFRSNSSEILLHAEVDGCRMYHMSLVGSMGPSATTRRFAITTATPRARTTRTTRNRAKQLIRLKLKLVVN